MRVVSLACSNTEIVAALGCSELLVGVDDHSDHPPAVVERLPRVGPDLEIDVEKVRALEPDLVLASLTVPGHETVVEGIEAAGLPTLTLAPTSMEDVYRNVVEVARALGVPERGEALAARMRDALAVRTSEEGMPDDPDVDAPSILIQWWPKPVIAPCGESWVNPVLRAAGARNPLASQPRPSRPLDDDEVAELNPDAIVISWCGVDPAKYRPDVVLRNPAFQELRAVRNRRVYCVPEAYLGRPGPRLVDGVQALKKIVESVRSQGAPDSVRTG